jgi:peptide/nickel transport system substrate-binding protein
VRASADFPTWAKRMGDMDFDLSWDTVFNWGDPVTGVHRTYLSSNIAKGVWSNTQGYANARVDEILAAAGRENDPAKRKALYAEFQQIIANELPLYVTNALPYHTVYSNKIGNQLTFGQNLFETMSTHPARRVLSPPQSPLLSRPYLAVRSR